jgi:hypothetical protein
MERDSGTGSEGPPSGEWADRIGRSACLYFLGLALLEREFTDRGLLEFATDA